MTAVELIDIDKRFGEVAALDKVSFRARAGEISALLGENGAGKSTLMNVLAGLYLPDSGQIRCDGRALTLGSPRQAIDLGIGMVHQHFQLVEPLTVAENVLIGMRAPRFRLRRDSAHRELEALARASGLQVQPGALVGSLSVGQKQQVEILKVLYRGAGILILDEPTAVLGPLEIEPFFDALRRLAAQGTAVVLIAHKLSEVLAVAERVSVLRRGRMVAVDRPIAEVDAAGLRGLILGERVATEGAPGDGAGVGAGVEGGAEKTPLLRLRNVHARGPRGEPALEEVDLALYPGEILGIAGVAGNGQRELAEVIVGLRAVEQGGLTLAGIDVTRLNVRARADLGIGYVPEDRLVSGVAPGLSATHNLALKLCRRSPHGVLLDWASLRAEAQKLVEQHDVRLESLDQPVGQLSGGNAQKLLLARELAATPRLLVAAQPTRGLDLGAAGTIRWRLRDLAAQGSGVLLISEDLDEVVELSHRVAVLSRGRVAGVVEEPARHIEQIGRWMLAQEKVA